MVAALVLSYAEAAPRTSGMEWAGGGSLPWIGDRIDLTGQPCFGEDSQAYTRLAGTLEAGAFAQAALPYICGSGGGNAALAVFATANGKAEQYLVASITRPDGRVVTHGDSLVCLSDTIWTQSPEVNAGEFLGDNNLVGGTYTLVVRNTGPRTVRNVVVDYQLKWGYALDGQCPAGDILVNGQ